MWDTKKKKNSIIQLISIPPSALDGSFVWLQPPTQRADLRPSGYWPDYLPSSDVSSCHHPAGIMDVLCCRNGRAHGAWTPDQVQPHNAQGSTFFLPTPSVFSFLFLILPYVVFFFPSNYLLLKFQSPFLRFCTELWTPCFIKFQLFFLAFLAFHLCIISINLPKPLPSLFYFLTPHLSFFPGLL